MDEIVGQRVALGLTDGLLSLLELGRPRRLIGVSGAKRRRQGIRGVRQRAIVVGHQGSECLAVDAQRGRELRGAIERVEG